MWRRGQGPVGERMGHTSGPNHLGLTGIQILRERTRQSWVREPEWPQGSFLQGPSLRDAQPAVPSASQVVSGLLPPLGSSANQLLEPSSSTAEMSLPANPQPPHLDFSVFCLHSLPEAPAQLRASHALHHRSDVSTRLSWHQSPLWLVGSLTCHLLSSSSQLSSC